MEKKQVKIAATAEGVIHPSLSELRLTLQFKESL